MNWIRLLFSRKRAERLAKIEKTHKGTRTIFEAAALVPETQ